MGTQMFWDSFNSLYSWVKRERYLGWDPYDGLSGEISRKFADKKLLNIVMIQLNLYSPINLRPILKIEKNRANKSSALFSRAYLHMYKTTKDSNFKIEAGRLLKELANKNLLKGKKQFACSSYYFEYIAPKHRLAPEIPDIICITEAIKSFTLAYETLKKKRYLVNSKRAVTTLIDELLCDDNKQGVVYFKYTPYEEDRIVFDVSALALDSISKFLRHSPDKELIGIGSEVLSSLLKYQANNGTWPFSYYIPKNSYYWQIDYHQGFIIDGLVSFLPYVQKRLRQRTLRAIKLAVEFYRHKQFNPDGWSYYRYPIKYPINIHNQAQGVITFTKLYHAFNTPKHLDFARKIATWTIKNMQDPTGYFYSHLWPGLTNKIPYMRWAQAWMMLALAILLEEELSKKSNVLWEGEQQCAASMDSHGVRYL